MDNLHLDITRTHRPGRKPIVEVRRRIQVRDESRFIRRTRADLAKLPPGPWTWTDETPGADGAPAAQYLMSFGNDAQIRRAVIQDGAPYLWGLGIATTAVTDYDPREVSRVRDFVASAPATVEALLAVIDQQLAEIRWLESELAAEEK